jgi:hypothetical protein
VQNFILDESIKSGVIKAFLCSLFYDFFDDSFYFQFADYLLPIL